ncbi:MAG: protein kinase [Pirellulales bacterium]|nr:protein kinase [Pirellulales bacterium]
MNEAKRCAGCGAELPADSPQGLCPVCLLKRGLAAQTAGATGSGPSDEFVPPTVEEIASHFPELEILGFLGRGGMGMVYKARQKRLDRLVALKILLPRIARDEVFAERFEREARAMAMLSHANIVAVYDFGQKAEGGALEGPLYYFLMEYVDGLSLRELLQTGRLAPAEALAIVPQICEALQYAHDNGLVHRDIKPANILLDKRGRVKIADFGLAKLLGRAPQEFSLTGTGQVMGTPHYMAPEQIEHPQQVDHRADIYSLGVVFYQMLTGELPLGRFAPPSKKVTVDVRLDEVVLKALERQPELRYQRASQVKTEVETIVGTPSPAAPPYARDSDSKQAIEQAREQVRSPAIGLLVTGILNWLVVPVIGAVFAYLSASASPPIPGFAEAAVVGILLTMLLVSGLVMFAALKMARLQAYGLAIAASILSMIISPGNVIGLPIGIWSLIVLTQPGVREAFRQNRTTGI